jgi:large subunit ribosomal protein L10
MEEPRPDKVAVIDEVRERLEGSTAAVVTEYRGLTVAEMADLRRILRAAGGDFKVFKNTLVRRALAGTSSESLDEFLVGPTALAFVQGGDVSAVAKALKDFADANPALVIKGGVFEGSALSADSLKKLANLPSRDVLLSQLAGLIASPMQNLAGLFKAVPQSLAYGLKALIESKPAEAGSPAAVEEAPAESPVAEAPVAEADVPAEAGEEAAAAPEEAPVAEAEVPAEPSAPEEEPGDEAPSDEA